MQTPTLLFDRALVKRRRNRAAPGFDTVDFLYREAAARLVDRLLDITLTFPQGALIGPHTAILHDALANTYEIERLIAAETVPAALEKSNLATLLCDEEWLPFAKDSLHLAMSLFALHTVNDLPGALAQLWHALKPDGLLLAVLPGPQTLRELRESLEAAMLEVEGGISPSVLPFVEVRDAGNLLQRVGYTLPVADSELVTVTYESAFALMQELRAMGENNSLIARRKQFMRRRTMFRAAELYQQRYGDAEGRVKATVELVFLTGWKG